MNVRSACVLAIVSTVGLAVSAASADNVYIVDDFSTGGYFTGLMSLPGSFPFDARDTMRSGDMPGLTAQRHVVMGLDGGPSSNVSGIAAGNVDGGVLHLGASISLSGSGVNRFVRASVSVGYTAVTTVDLTQATLACYTGGPYYNGSGLTYASLVLIDQNTLIRQYEASTIGPAGLFNVGFNLAMPFSSEAGFDMSNVRSIQWGLGAYLDPFNGAGNGTGDYTVDIDTFSITFVPSPGAAALGGLAMAAGLRRRR